MNERRPDGLTRRTVTDAATIDVVLSRLAASDVVDGLALYGSRTGGVPGSDYDILVLATERPGGMTQVFTHVDGHATDVLFLDAATYDEVMAGRRRVNASTVDAVFLRKLPHAEIVVDRSGRLARGRDAGLDAGLDGDWLRPPSYSSQYLLWFSLNFSLAHMKRLAASIDPAYVVAIDLMLGAQPGLACRTYFAMRRLPWDGEKAAVRHLQQHDPGYLALLRECLASTDRSQKLDRYERLAALTLEPFGDVWAADAAAASFETPVHDAAQVNDALDLWARILRV